MSSYIL